MNIVDKMYNHDLTPYSYEYIDDFGNKKMHYMPFEDPLFHDYATIFGIHDMMTLDKEECQLVVFSDEESPRMHIFNEDGSFACCIDLFQPKYYENEDEHSHLNNIQKIKLMEYLSIPYSSVVKDHWDLCVKQWYTQNDQDELGDSNYGDMPDYTQLPE